MSVPDILYHYCSVDSFYKIVQSNEIWLSDSYVLNDYKENTWITPILKEIFAIKRNQKYGELFDKILQTYELNNRGIRLTPVYTISFIPACRLGRRGCALPLQGRWLRLAEPNGRTASHVTAMSFG